MKEAKAELKRLKGERKVARRERSHSEAEALDREAEALEARLARHKALEDEARQLRADLRATERRQEDLVEAARKKIDREEARRVILDRLRQQLVATYETYLKADQRACLAALENLHGKYAVTAAEIEAKRDAAAVKLKGFLVELGYG